MKKYKQKNNFHKSNVHRHAFFFFIASCIELSANINFWIESVCLSSEGKEFHIVGAAKENERCPNDFVRSLRIYTILLSEEERKFLYGVCTKSKSDK